MILPATIPGIIVISCQISDAKIDCTDLLSLLDGYNTLIPAVGADEHIAPQTGLSVLPSCQCRCLQAFAQVGLASRDLLYNRVGFILRLHFLPLAESQVGRAASILRAHLEKE